MTLQNAHAQNYHIFTPAEGKDWCMFWGPQQWVKDLPYANAACNYNFRPGQPGHLRSRILDHALRLRRRRRPATRRRIRADGKQNHRPVLGGD